MDDLYKIISEVFEIDINDINDELCPNEMEAWDPLGQQKLISATPELV